MRRLNAFPLPIWVKLLIAITAAITLLLVPLLALVRVGIDEIGQQNGLAFTSENGARQAASVGSAITQARDVLDRFAELPANERLLTAALLGGVQSDVALNLPQPSPDTLDALFTRGLLGTVGAVYENVRLLDRTGQVVARGVAAGPSILTATDESASPVFQAATAAQAQGETRTFSVSFENIPILDYARAIVWRDGSVIGYLVGRMSNARVIYQQLRFNTDLYPAYTYLADTQGNLIAPSLEVTLRIANGNRSIIERAYRGESGTDSYRLENGIEVVGYYAPVRGTPLVLVTEVPRDAVFSRALEFFSVRAAIAGLGIGALILIFVVALSQIVVPPLRRLQSAAEGVANGQYDLALPDAGRGDEIGELTTHFATMRDSVRAQVEELQSRLDARARDMSATQDIGRFAVMQRDAGALMDRVVDLIVERFPVVYHAQIFLLDGDRINAVVRASTGEVGRELIRRGHQLAVGSVSVIGQVTDQGRVIHARDTEASPVHRRNPLLPDTQAELAIPLRVGDTLIGALDVQSYSRDAFTDDLINVLTTVADQVAIAIQNAQLYEEDQRRTAGVDERNRRETLRVWQEYMRDQRQPQMEKTDGEPNSEIISDLRRAAMSSGEPVTGAKTTRDTIPFALPIVLRGQVLGAVEWELPAATFGDDKLELARELTNRLAVSLDNARLFQESRRTTERERAVNAITARLTAQTTIDSILKTAVREVGQALHSPQITIRLRPVDANVPRALTDGTPGNSAPLPDLWGAPVQLDSSARRIPEGRGEAASTGIAQPGDYAAVSSTVLKTGEMVSTPPIPTPENRSTPDPSTSVG